MNLWRMCRWRLPRCRKQRQASLKKSQIHLIHILHFQQMLSKNETHPTVFARIFRRSFHRFPALFLDDFPIGLLSVVGHLRDGIRIASVRCGHDVLSSPTMSRAACDATIF